MLLAESEAQPSLQLTEELCEDFERSPCSSPLLIFLAAELIQEADGDLLPPPCKVLAFSASWERQRHELSNPRSLQMVTYKGQSK